MSDNKTLRDRLAENAARGVKFLTRNAEDIGLTVSSGAVLAAVTLIASQHGSPSLTNNQMLSYTLGLLTLSSAGMATYLGSKTYESMVKEVAPEWLPNAKNDSFGNDGQTALQAKVPARFEVSRIVEEMGVKMGDRLIKMCVGTSLEKAFDEDRVADYKRRVGSDLEVR
ncbi:MAG: hypothetical protein RSG77_14935 [Hafnia sp.]